MNKKLITIIAMLALVSSFVMAAQEVSSDLPAPAYTEEVYSLGTSSSSSTVVADSESIEFVYALEAKNGEDWVLAEDQKVYDSTWNVRAGFNVDFRIRATAGTINAVSLVKATVTVGKLTHTALSGTIVDKSITISGATAGDRLTLVTATGGGTATGGDAAYVISFETQSGFNYGVDEETQADESVSFNIAYAGDSAAPAGRYESTVLVKYEAI